MGRGGSSPLQRMRSRRGIPPRQQRGLRRLRSGVVGSCEAMREPVQQPSTRRSAPGRSYADARAVVRRAQSVGTKNGRVDTLADAETEGHRRPRARRRRLGLRLPTAGSRPRARATPRSAPAAFAAAAGGTTHRALAPVEARSGHVPHADASATRSTSPVEEKVALCLRAEEALRHPDVKVAEAAVRALARAASSSSPPTGSRSTRSSSSAAAASTAIAIARRARPGPRATRAPTSARARRRAGSTSRASASSARRRASPRRRPRCSAPTSARPA